MHTQGDREMKKPFLTLAQAQEIKKTYPTPYHI